MKSLFPLSLMLATLTLPAVSTPSVFAQGPDVEEVSGSFFEPLSNTYFRLHHVEGRQLGDVEPYTMGGATHYFELPDGIFMLDAQGRFTNDGDAGGSIGAVSRLLAEDSIFGTGVWVDFNESALGNSYQQIGFSFEWFRDLWSLRANGNIPLGDRRRTLANGVRTSPFGVRYLGNHIVYGSDVFRSEEVALDSWELELARHINDYSAEAYTGYYNFQATGEQTHGFKLGIRGYLTEQLAASATVSEDTTFGTNVFGSITFFFGGPGGNKPHVFEDKLTIPVQREYQVATRNRLVLTGNDLTILTDPVSSQPIIVEHVSSSAAAGGDGTFENPLNSINDIFANSADGTTTNGNIVFVYSGSTFTGEAAALHDNQRLLGEGITHTVDTAELGTINMLAANGGSAVPVFASAPADAITLGSIGNEVSGFTIDGGTRAIVNDGGAADTNINRVTIQNTTGDGIVITPSTNTTINNVVFTNVGGADIVLNAANSTITNITSTNSGSGGGIFLSNLTGTTNITNVNLTGAAANGWGGVVLDNAQSGSQTNITNLDVSGGVAGLVISDSDANATFTLNDLDLDSNAIVGIYLDDVSGTFNFTDTTVSNPFGIGIAVTGGDADCTFAGTTSITNRAAQGIALWSTAANVDFGGTTITGSGGTEAGVEAIDTTGNISFDSLSVSGSGGHGALVSNADSFSIGTEGSTAGDGGTINGAAGAGILAINSNVDIRYMNISGTTGTVGGPGEFGDMDGDPEHGWGIAFGQWETNTRTVVLEGNNITNSAEGGIYAYSINGTVDMTISNNTITGSGSSGGIEIIGGEGSGDGTLSLHHNTITAGTGILGRLSETMTVTDFRDNVVNSGSYGIDLGSTFDFDADPSTSAFDPVDGGTMILGSAGNRIQGTGLELTGDGALQFDSVQIFTQGKYSFSGEDAIRMAFNQFNLTIGDGTTASTIDMIDAEPVSAFVSDNAIEFHVNAGSSLTINDLNINMNGSTSPAFWLRNRSGGTAIDLAGDDGNTTTNVNTFKEVGDAGGGFNGTIDFDSGTNTLP